MANVDSPFGFKPIRYQSGAPYNGAANPYYVFSTYAVALFIGDGVSCVGTANTAAFEGWAIGTLPSVEVFAGADAAIPTGVIVGIGPNRNDLTQQYHPASTEGIVWVADDPTLEFEIQADGAIPAASIGLNGILIATHSGDTATGLSGYELDTTSTAPSADASNPLTILRAVARDDNDCTLTHAKVLVRFNLHSEALGVLGI